MVENKKLRSQRTTAFKMDAKILLYECAPEIFHSDNGVNLLKHTSVA